jgi:hypothetical protein
MGAHEADPINGQRIGVEMLGEILDDLDRRIL